LEGDKARKLPWLIATLWRNPLSYLPLVLIAASSAAAATLTVDCSTGGAMGPTLTSLKSGDILSAQGMCRENIVISADLHDIMVDGQGKATIAATDRRQPAVQV